MSADDSKALLDAPGVLDLPLVLLPNRHPCARCGECCTYVATMIDNPRTFAEYENVHWYLTHHNVCVYIDWEGDWYIEFKTDCRHLTPDKTCGIYLDRPKICSDFSFHDCERNSGESAAKQLFRAPQDLFDFMARQRPKAYKAWAQKRSKLVAERTKAARKAS